MSYNINIKAKIISTNVIPMIINAPIPFLTNFLSKAFL